MDGRQSTGARINRLLVHFAMTNSQVDNPAGPENPQRICPSGNHVDLIELLHTRNRQDGNGFARLRWII